MNDAAYGEIAALGELPVCVELHLDTVLSLARRADQERRKALKAAEKARSRGIDALVGANRSAADHWRHTAELLFAAGDEALARAYPVPPQVPQLLTVRRDHARWVVRLVGGARVFIADVDPPEPGTWVHVHGRDAVVRSARLNEVGQ